MHRGHQPNKDSHKIERQDSLTSLHRTKREYRAQPAEVPASAPSEERKSILQLEQQRGLEVEVLVKVCDELEGLEVERHDGRVRTLVVDVAGASGEHESEADLHAVDGLGVEAEHVW